MRLREMEQKELERQYGKKKAKEVAQQKFNVSTSQNRNDFVRLTVRASVCQNLIRANVF